MSRRRPWEPGWYARDYADLAYMLALGVLFAALVAAWVWVSFVAPCGELGWLPIRSLPARCFEGVQR